MVTSHSFVPPESISAVEVGKCCATDEVCVQHIHLQRGRRRTAAPYLTAESLERETKARSQSEQSDQGARRSSLQSATGRVGCVNGWNKRPRGRRPTAVGDLKAAGRARKLYGQENVTCAVDAGAPGFFRGTARRYSLRPDRKNGREEESAFDRRYHPRRNPPDVDSVTDQRG
jgi:hypothetical protein